MSKANPFRTMSEQILGMQRYFNRRYSEEEKQDPDIKKAINLLLQTRCALERLWTRTSKNS